MHPLCKCSPLLRFKKNLLYYYKYKGFHNMIQQATGAPLQTFVEGYGLWQSLSFQIPSDQEKAFLHFKL